MSWFPDAETIHLLAERVWNRCDRLATLSEEPGRLTRTFLSPPMRDVHATLTEAMESCGMTARVDAVGNIIGRYAAQTEPAPTFLLGSHLDTVPNAGKYDGPLGVLLALAVVEALAGKRLPFALEVIGFSDEEGVRYRTPYLGSRAVVGQFPPELLTLRDKDGIWLQDCLQQFGLNPADIPAARLTEQVIGYLETHIEQGPVLEKRALPVGVVGAIAGQSRLRICFTGQAAHAGTTPMGPLRHDALAGIAEFIGAVESVGLGTMGLVATVGAITVVPNAGNVIPATAEISLDIRHAEDAVRQQAIAHLSQQVEIITRKRGLKWDILGVNDFEAVPMNTDLQQLLRAAIEQENMPVLEMISGAGHDAAILAAHVPVAMLFLRSPNGGISHHPDEAVLLEDIEIALRVMLRFVLQLEPFVAKQKEEKKW